jgi:hypothetical protein
MVKKLYGASLQEYLASMPERAPFLESWQEFVAGLLAYPSNERRQAVVRDVFGLELRIADLNDSIESDSLLAYKKKMILLDAQRLQALPPGQFQAQQLVVDGDLVIASCEWNWNEPARWPDNVNQEPGEFFYLLMPSYKGINEWLISPFTYLILKEFETPQAVGKAVEGIVAELESPDQAAGQTEQMVIGQIKELIKSGLLLDPNQHPLNSRITALLEGVAEL